MPSLLPHPERPPSTSSRGAPFHLILSLSKGEVEGVAVSWHNPRMIREIATTVYILRCADGSYYTGCTKQDVEARVWEHNNLPGEKSFTAKRRPVVLVFCEEYGRITDAIARERQIKGWSRAKKEALIALQYERLPELAKNRQGIGHPRPSTSSG